MDLMFLITFFFGFDMRIKGFMDTDLVLSFFKAKNLKYNTVLTCYDKKAQMELSKNFNVNKNMVLSIKYIKYLNILDSLVTNYKKMGVVLDGDCVDATGLLLRCRRYKVFDSKHFWLVLHNSSHYRDLFKFANLNIDSDIKVAYPNFTSNNDISTTKYIIDDVYNPAYGKGGEFKSLQVGSYDSYHGYRINEVQNKYFIRKNLTGVHFKAVVVLPVPFEGSLEDYLRNNRSIHINTLNRFHSRLMNYCRDYYNFSMQIGVTKSWGYLQPDGTMDGLVGELNRQTADFGLSPLLVKKERARVMTYGMKTWNLRGAFILRNPKSRKPYQIFLKPLSAHVWICIFLSSTLSVYAQTMGYQFDEKIDKKHSKREDVDTSWSFSAICTFGAFCQQGIIAFPNCLSGRIAAYTTLLLGLLINQFYSASLVSFLLNVPTTVINSVQSILENNFKIGCEDILYFKDFLKYSTDSVTQEVYNKLLTVAGNQSGFLRPKEGLDLVKKGQYAFYIELVTGYPIIQHEFNEKTICELKEIPMFLVKPMHANYQKWSPFKDIMDVCLQRFGENGVIGREIRFWHPRKPECMRSASTIKINTGLADFYPALVVLLAGIILSLHIYVIEVMWHRRCQQKKP